jgi:hypothetical protein
LPLGAVVYHFTAVIITNVSGYTTAPTVQFNAVGGGRGATATATLSSVLGGLSIMLEEGEEASSVLGGLSVTLEEGEEAASGHGASEDGEKRTGGEKERKEVEERKVEVYMSWRKRS